jgi:hypothetical protein
LQRFLDESSAYTESVTDLIHHMTPEDSPYPLDNDCQDSNPFSSLEENQTTEAGRDKDESTGSAKAILELKHPSTSTREKEKTYHASQLPQERERFLLDGAASKLSLVKLREESEKQSSAAALEASAGQFMVGVQDTRGAIEELLGSSDVSLSPPIAEEPLVEKSHGTPSSVSLEDAGIRGERVSSSAQQQPRDNLGHESSYHFEALVLTQQNAQSPTNDPPSWHRASPITNMQQSANVLDTVYPAL